MQKENVKRDNRILIDFWDQAFTLTEEQKVQLWNQQEDWKELAPSEKLFQAAFSLGERKKVLDVIPPETTDAILRETARVLKRGGSMIVGLNYYLSPETTAARGMELTDGNRLYMEGVLRLVSRTDAEWARVFSPWYSIDGLEHFAWPGEAKETRRLFRLR